MTRFLCFVLLMLATPARAADVQEIVTPGGFTLWLTEDHSLPLVAINLTFTGSGTAYDPPEKNGRATMTASLLLEGAGARGAKDFHAALEDEAVRLNIAAGADDMTFMMQSLSDRLEVAFSLLADAMIRPRFDEEAIERSRAQMLSVLRQQDGAPHYLLMQAFQKNMLGNHPYHQSGLGTPTSLSALTREDFMRVTTAYLTRQNIVISVVGDVSAADLAALVDRYFAALPAQYTPDVALDQANIPHEAAYQEIAHTMPQSMVRFGLAGVLRRDPDYIPAYVMNHLLGGGGLDSRLASEIRVKRGLAYSVQTQLTPQKHAALWQGMFATRTQDAPQAIEVLRAVLADFAKNGPSEEELEAAKSYLTGSFILDLSSNQGVANFLTIMQLHGLGRDYLSRRNGLIAAVTRQDIARVTQRIVKPENLRIVVLGKTERP